MEKQKFKRKTACVIVAAVTTLVVAAFVLVGCSLFNKDEPIEEQIPDIETQVYGALNDALNEAMSDDESSDELLTGTDNRNGFEVISYRETETGVVATLRVYAPDLCTVVEEIDENYVFETEEELRKVLIEAIEKADIVEQEVTIEFEKTEFGYEPIITIELIDAYYGGILKFYNETITNMQKEDEE